MKLTTTLEAQVWLTCYHAAVTRGGTHLEGRAEEADAGLELFRKRMPKTSQYSNGLLSREARVAHPDEPEITPRKGRYPNNWILDRLHQAGSKGLTVRELFDWQERAGFVATLVSIRAELKKLAAKHLVIQEGKRWLLRAHWLATRAQNLKVSR